VAAAMATVEFDAARLEARAADGWTTLTELADTLVRDHHVPFRTAHAIAARLITGRQQDRARPLADLLMAASRDLAGEGLAYSERALEEILSPRHFVEVRKTLGGPAPSETGRAAEASRLQLAADEAWWKSAMGALADAERRLRERSSQL